MPGSENLAPGDVVAVALPPGPVWIELVARVWDAEAALLPLDVNLPARGVRDLLERSRPTVHLDRTGWSRPAGGVAGDPGLALIVPTSGTAGRPKLVELGRDAVRAAVQGSAAALGATAGEPWLSCLTPAHVGGLLVLLRGVLLGAPVIAHPGFDPNAVAKEKPGGFVSIVPTMLLRLVRAGVDLSRFRAILVGGAGLAPEVRRLAEDGGARIVPTYGLTESCGGVVYDGRPIADVRVRIEPQAGGVELEGSTLMRGYRFDPGETANTLRPDGWLRTGDAGVIDDVGRLRILGRLDDLIISGGEKVWPKEVEEVLRAHPGVAEVAVLGRPDPEWGRRIVAYVVPTDPADPPTLDDLRDLVGRSLSRHKAPRDLVVVDRIPRTPFGKVRRAALPNEATE